MRSPVHSVKNQFQTNQSITTSLNQDFVYTAVEVGVATKITGKEVPVGANVYSVDVTVNYVTGGGAQIGNFDWCLIKLREGQSVVSTITSPDWTDIGLSSGRNQVIKSYTTMFGTDDGAIVKYNVHIKIPKSMQRVRSGDLLVIAFQASQSGTSVTGARYKYYT